MKKIGLIVAMLMICTPAHANRFFVEEVTLKDTSGTEISAYALTSGSAVYTTPIQVYKNVGFMSLLVIENKAGGAGDVDISAEYSLDGTNFYTAYYTDLDGTLSAEGNIVTALGNVSRWIVYPPKLSKFIRFKLDPDADSQITLTMIYQEMR
jgi:hypothetical protein